MSRTQLKINGQKINDLTAEFYDYFPLWGMLPELDRAAVDRFVALGEAGAKHMTTGNLDGAETSFRAQLEIFRGNPRPWVDLALVEAARVAELEDASAPAEQVTRSVDAAVAHLENAVKRGFPDLMALLQSEGWSVMEGKRTNRLLDIQEAARASAVLEKQWAKWDAYAVPRAPETYARAVEIHDTNVARIRHLEPVLGAVQTRRWMVLADRILAAHLRQYAKSGAEAEDVGRALDRLLELYTGDRFLTWSVLSSDTAKLLEDAAKRVLGNPASSSRPRALVARSLALYGARDKNGSLPQSSVDSIREALNEVVADPDSPVFDIAAAGLLRTEAKFGSLDVAKTRYMRIREEHPARATGVRKNLGLLALTLGGLPDFSATTLNGEPVEAADLEGRVSVWDFWATWCDPCKEGLPTLDKIAKRFGDQVVIVAVNMDGIEDDVAYVQEWVDREKVPGTYQLLASGGFDSRLAADFCVEEIPFTVVVGVDGAVLAINKEKKDLMKAVAAAVKRGDGSAEVVVSRNLDEESP